MFIKEELDSKEPSTPTPVSPNPVNPDDEPRWRSLLWSLNTILQIITLYAPGALVW